MLIPSPSDTVLFIFNEGIDKVLYNVYRTLFNSVSGFLLAFLLALASIVGAYMNTHVKALVDALNTFIQSVSVLVWSIVFLMIFGVTSIAPPILVVTAAAYPVLLSSFIGSVFSLDKKFSELARILGASKLQELYYFILPGSFPYIASASRSALGLALRISVVAEAFGASGGVGYQLVYSYDLGFKEGVFAWGIILVLLMIFLDYIVLRPVEGWSKKWML